MLEVMAEEDTELIAADEGIELTADDREAMEAAELDNIELTTDELDDLDPEPDPPPQAVRASRTANKLQRLIFIVITLLWFLGNLASQPQARHPVGYKWRSI
jgi:hypothetical protein